MFYKRHCKKKNQKEFSVEKVIKRKGAKLYVKWKKGNNSTAGADTLDFAKKADLCSLK